MPSSRAGTAQKYRRRTRCGPARRQLFTRAISAATRSGGSRCGSCSRRSASRTSCSGNGQPRLDTRLSENAHARFTRPPVRLGVNQVPSRSRKSIQFAHQLSAADSCGSGRSQDRATPSPRYLPAPDPREPPRKSRPPPRPRSRSSHHWTGINAQSDASESATRPASPASLASPAMKNASSRFRVKHIFVRKLKLSSHRATSRGRCRQRRAKPCSGSCNVESNTATSKPAARSHAAASNVCSGGYGCIFAHLLAIEVEVIAVREQDTSAMAHAQQVTALRRTAGVHFRLRRANTSWHAV